MGRQEMSAYAYAKYLEGNQEERDRLGLPEGFPVTASRLGKALRKLEQTLDLAGLGVKHKKSGRPSTVPDWAMAEIMVSMMDDATISIKNIEIALRAIAERKKCDPPNYYAIRRAALLVREKDTHLVLRSALRGGIFSNHGIKLERPAQAANNQWQIDAHSCDFLVMGPEGETVRPQLVSVVDTYTGLPMGWGLFPARPNSKDMLTVIRSAILPKGGERSWGGLPGEIQSDNGAEFKSADYRRVLASIGVNVRYIARKQCPQNGVIENHFGIIEKKFGNEFPAFLKLARKVDTLDVYLGNWDGFKATFNDFMMDFALNQTHSEFAAPRYEAWYRNLPDEGIKWVSADALDEKMLFIEMRKVTDGGVCVDNRHYTHPNLATFIGATVTIGMTVHDKPLRIFAWHKTQKIGELRPTNDVGLRKAVNEANILANDNAKKVAMLLKQSRRTGGGRKHTTVFDKIKWNSLKTGSFRRPGKGNRGGGSKWA